MERRMVGLVTERELPLAEVEWPGISEFFASEAVPATTFLELVWHFEKAKERNRRRPS
jgi:hypothetical protein